MIYKYLRFVIITLYDKQEKLGYITTERRLERGVVRRGIAAHVVGGGAARKQRKGRVARRAREQHAAEAALW